ncbi:MAG: AMP-binding protein, partial [Prevotella sp.]|nr:AMP-binding protein [Prevotella sp.]
DEGEILLKGPTITRGYYKRDDVNATAFDSDGFFHTGDAGYMRNGELFLTERIKDLYKTSNGKYIAPQMVEAMLLVDKFIDQVAVVADQRQYATALIVPEFRLVEEWASDQGLHFESREELCQSRAVNDMLKERIDTLQQRLSGYEQIKRFTLIPHHFSLESGELTNTLKMKRSVINKNYKAVIDLMYNE